MALARALFLNLMNRLCLISDSSDNGKRALEKAESSDSSDDGGRALEKAEGESLKLSWFSASVAESQWRQAQYEK